MAGRELVVVAGNHDHALVEPWLTHRGEEDDPAPLGVEQWLDPARASPAMERIAGWASPARVRAAYPGLWLRPDVYATHRALSRLPSDGSDALERLSVGAMSRLLGRPASTFDSVGDYEAMGAPVFAWRDAVARDARTGAALNGMAARHRLACAQGRLHSGRARPRRDREAAATPRDRRGLPTRRGRAQPRGDRPAARGRVDARAASRRAARDGGGRGAPRPRRRVCRLRPHPPGGAAPGDEEQEWRGRRRRPAGERR